MNEHEEVITAIASIKTDELMPMIRESTKPKSFKESLVDLLGVPVDRQSLVEMMNNENVPDNPTMADVMAGAMIVKASYGDTKAFEVIRDTIGQKPVDKVVEDRTVRVMLDPTIERFGE